VVEAIVSPDNHASMELANRLGIHVAGSISKHRTDTGGCIQRRRLVLEYQPWVAAGPASGFWSGRLATHGGRHPTSGF